MIEKQIEQLPFKPSRTKLWRYLVATAVPFESELPLLTVVVRSLYLHLSQHKLVRENCEPCQYVGKPCN